MYYCYQRGFLVSGVEKRSFSSCVSALRSWAREVASITDLILRICLQGGCQGSRWWKVVRSWRKDLKIGYNFCILSIPFTVKMSFSDPHYDFPPFVWQNFRGKTDTRLLNCLKILAPWAGPNKSFSVILITTLIIMTIRLTAVWCQNTLPYFFPSALQLGFYYYFHFTD